MSDRASGLFKDTASSGDRARVVLLLQDLKFGGTQRQALELARGLDRSLFAVELWVMQAGDDFVPFAERHGLKIVWLGRGSYVWPPALFGLWRQLWRQRPHVILMMTGIPNIWGRLLGWRSGGPVLVGSIRGSQDPDRQHERWLWSFAHHHVCNAFSLKELLMRLCPIADGRVSVIPNGVDLDRYEQVVRPGNGHRRVLLCLGRLVPEKDHLSLISAFEQIAPSHPEAELLIVGDGPLRDSLARRIEQSPVRHLIVLRPGRHEVETLLADAWCLVLPSRHEGLPNVVLEAMASGVPVVASALPGVEEVLGGGTGLLVPPGDVDALAGSLRSILVDPDLKRDLGQRARVRVRERYGLETMASSYENLFRRLISDHLPREAQPWQGVG